MISSHSEFEGKFGSIYRMLYDNTMDIFTQHLKDEDDAIMFSQLLINILADHIVACSKAARWDREKFAVHLDTYSRVLKEITKRKLEDLNETTTMD